MDALDLESNLGARDYFTGIKHPCPSNLCEGFLTEYEQETWEPFKAFLMCPDCESRLRLYRKKKG